MKTHEAVVVLHALDALGVALAEHDHWWSPEQRTLYEDAIRILSPLVGDAREHILDAHCWCQPEVISVKSYEG